MTRPKGLSATFVRRHTGRDRVYVTRSDGTATGWDFPSYGEGLPHDLCHLVVEGELGISDGFWGLVDRGVDVGLVDNRATLMFEGRPFTQGHGAEIAGLLLAEAAVAALTSLGAAPADMPGAPVVADREVLDRLRDRLVVLQTAWAALEDGGSITLTLTGG